MLGRAFLNANDPSTGYWAGMGREAAQYEAVTLRQALARYHMGECVQAACRECLYLYTGFCTASE